ncbi:hypothetical protein ACGFY7_40250 [Streptomyces prunicolor]|uniref:hypothetical protein n=1 Tax=Streptomyces prunicolor TaxID=67348 RepID=UPI003716CA70
MRIGLVGLLRLGRIGAFHARTLSVLPSENTLVVTAAAADRAADTAGKPDAHAVGSVDALGTGLDDVVIAATTEARPALPIATSTDTRTALLIAAATDGAPPCWRPRSRRGARPLREAGHRGHRRGGPDSPPPP